MEYFSITTEQSAFRTIVDCMDQRRIKEAVLWAASPPTTRLTCPWIWSVPSSLPGFPLAYQLDITSLPKIQIGLDPITINPLSLSLQITQIPSVRAHVPANFVAGFSIFGFQLASIQLCGEAQVNTEPYVPTLWSRVGPRYHCAAVSPA